MADISELKVEVTLTIGELRDLVALVNVATDAVLASEQQVPDIVEEISTMYFELTENMKDGTFGAFGPG